MVSLLLSVFFRIDLNFAVVDANKLSAQDSGHILKHDWLPELFLVWIFCPSYLQSCTDCLRCSVGFKKSSPALGTY
jgi:hypothetical protein